MTIFEFNEEWYIAYHAQTLAHAMGEAKGYRSTHLNKVYMNEDGSIPNIQADYEGVDQLKPLNPFQRVEAETFAWNAGIQTRPMDEGEPMNRVLTDIQSGDWIALSKGDFGELERPPSRRRSQMQGRTVLSNCASAASTDHCSAHYRSP